MLRKLHTRYLIVLIVMLALCFIVFSSLFMFALNRTVNSRMQSTLESNNTYAVQIVETLDSLPYPSEILATYRNQVFRSMQVLADYTSTDLTLCTPDGLVFFSTSDNLSGCTIDLNALLSTSVRYGMLQSDFSGLFEEKQFASVAPVVIGNQTICYSIASTSAGYYNQMLKSFTSNFWIRAIIIFSITAILFIIITRRQLRPIREMTAAAKKYAKGQFDTRIEESNIEEIDELGSAFNNMADSLERLEDMRNSFVQNISHDLRTPMTTINGFIDGILDGTIPKEQEEYYLTLVSAETKRLSRLVSSLLDLSDLESGRDRQIVTFDIAEVIRRILFSLEQRIDHKKIHLDFDFDMEPLTVTGDKDGLYRVVYNLIDNAVKYSFDEGTIRVTTAKNQTHAIITVYNTGMGIKENDIPFVFDRFYKADKSRGRDKSSIGLGLYITKTIAENNGGDIMVRSKYGEYCEFSFTVPLKTGGN